jgi:hypothetical protein
MYVASASPLDLVRGALSAIEGHADLVSRANAGHDVLLRNAVARDERIARVGPNSRGTAIARVKTMLGCRPFQNRRFVGDCD